MKKLLIPLFFLALFSSCSVFQETESYEEVDNDKPDDTEEVYVFDEVKDDQAKQSEIKDLNNEIDSTLDNNTNNASSETEDNVVKTTTEPVTVVQEDNKTVTTTYEQPVNNVKFYVQLGAFSTIERAERFSSQIDSEVPFELSIIFDSSNGLYIVRSVPYATRTEADNIKYGLRKKNKFKDCFIVTE